MHHNDAQAIAEACQHGAIRPVPIKTLELQDIPDIFKHAPTGFNGEGTTDKLFA